MVIGKAIEVMVAIGSRGLEPLPFNKNHRTNLLDPIVVDVERGITVNSRAGLGSVNT
jgi:hypothetical protein